MRISTSLLGAVGVTLNFNHEKESCVHAHQRYMLSSNFSNYEDWGKNGTNISDSKEDEWHNLYPGEITPKVAAFAVGVSLCLVTVVGLFYVIIECMCKSCVEKIVAAIQGPNKPATITEVVDEFDDLDDDDVDTLHDDPRADGNALRKTTTFVASGQTVNHAH